MIELLRTKSHLIAIDGNCSLWIPTDGSAPLCHPGELPSSFDMYSIPYVAKLT